MSAPTLTDRIRATATAVRAGAGPRRSIALRAAACVAVPLVIGLVVGAPTAGAQASFGGLAGLYVPEAPFRYRAKVVAAIGAGLTLAVFAGALAGRHGWTAALVAGAVAAVASFVCQAAELPPPRELMIVMTVLVATALPGGVGDAWNRALLTAAGAAFALLVVVSPAVRRRRPEAAAVTGAIRGIAGLLERIGADDRAAEATARHGAVVGVRRARNAVAQSGVRGDHRLSRAVVAIEGLLEAVLSVEVESTGPLPREWAYTVRGLSAAVDRRAGPSAEPAGLRTPSSELAGLAAAVERLRSVLNDGDAGQEPSGETVPAPRWPGLARQLSAAFRRHSVVIPTAARIGIAVGLGVGIGTVLGVAHAYWVGLTAVAVLQGSNLTATRSRLVNRLLGTIIGVGVAFALLSWQPPVWVLIAAVAACQFLVELVIVTNYGIAVVVITVLALVLFEISAGADLGPAVVARLIDTAIGTAVALVVRLGLWPQATAARVPLLQARVLRSVRTLLSESWAAERNRSVVVVRRRQLEGDLAALRTVQADALADSVGGATAAERRWPVTVAVEELAYVALAIPEDRPRPDTAHAAAFLESIDGIATAAVSAPETLPTTADFPLTPALPNYPRTSRALTNVRIALDGS